MALRRFFCAGAALLDQGQIVPPRRSAIGAHLHFRSQQGMEDVDNRLTDLASLIEQAHISGIADRLLNYRGVNDELAAMCRWLLIRRRRLTIVRRCGGLLTYGQVGDDAVLEPRKNLWPHAPTNLDKQRRCESLFLMKDLEADEVLEIRVLADLLDCLLVAQAQLVAL